MTDTPPAVWPRIAADLAARIGAGQFCGGQLPGERVLAREYGVAYLTMRRVTRELRERGLITTSQGRPSRILPPPAHGPGS
jgi:DNA-binding GntR family transcriptional regulator